jgi:hypothetical protein
MIPCMLAWHGMECCERRQDTQYTTLARARGFVVVSGQVLYSLQNTTGSTIVQSSGRIRVSMHVPYRFERIAHRLVL